MHVAKCKNPLLARNKTSVGTLCLDLCSHDYEFHSMDRLEGNYFESFNKWLVGLPFIGKDCW